MEGNQQKERDRDCGKCRANLRRRHFQTMANRHRDVKCSGHAKKQLLGRKERKTT